MSLQARAGEWDHRLYNVNRDCAHCFGDIMREVAARLEDKRWPILAEILEKDGVTEDDLGNACAAFCIFVQAATELPKERMGEALERCGWVKVPEAAQVALMAMIGTVMAGYFWAGVREATVQGNGPCQNYQDLREVGRLACGQLAVPRWKRRWNSWKSRFRAALSVIRGRS